MNSYILKSDLDMPENERTVWHIQPVDTISSFDFIKKLINGVDFFSDPREEWIQRIFRVENYQFGYKYPELKKRGFISFSDKETIEKVYFDIGYDFVDEILKYAREVNYISPLMRKKIEFAVFYFKWKSQDLQRQIQYDCRNCLKNGWSEKRVCFKEKEKHIIPFPVFDEDAKIPRTIDTDEQESSVDDVYEWLLNMESVFTNAPCFDVLKENLKPICFEGIVDPIAAQYFRLENAVDSYGFDVLKQPFWLFEIFESVRSASNIYENVENFKREQSLKSKDLRGKNG